MSNLQKQEQNSKAIDFKNQNVITTELLAERLGIDAKALNDNFRNNKERYQEGLHYFELKGSGLKDFKMHSEIFGVHINAKVSKLYLWTEKGAFNHVKSVGTDEAWDVFQVLVDTYFRQRDALKAVQEKINDKPKTTTAELILLQAQALVEQERRIISIEEKVSEIEAKQTTHPQDYFAIAGYAALKKIPIDLKMASNIGKKATVLCNQLGFIMGSVPDPRFGKVKTYPKDVLETVFKEVA